jgi:hypothetical protein
LTTFTDHRQFPGRGVLLPAQPTPWGHPRGATPEGGVVRERAGTASFRQKGARRRPPDGKTNTRSGPGETCPLRGRASRIPTPSPPAPFAARRLGVVTLNLFPHLSKNSPVRPLAGVNRLGLAIARLAQSALPAVRRQCRSWFVNSRSALPRGRPRGSPALAGRGTRLC